MAVGRFRAALLNLLGVQALVSGITKEGRIYGGAWYGEQTSSGQYVSVDSALQLSTVWACVRLLSQTISTLPLKLYRRTTDGRELASNHPLYTVLCKSPNLQMTPARFMLTNIASLTLRGNAYVEKPRVGRKVVALQPLLPQFVKPELLDNGRLSYDYQPPGFEKRKIADTDMMHIRGFGIDGMLGLEPVTTGRDVIGAAAAANDLAAKTFKNGAAMSGILNLDRTLDKEQRERYQKNLDRFTGSGSKAGGIFINEVGGKYEGITMNPEAAQLLETRAYGVEEICRWYGVPPFMVGHMDKQSSWASSVEGSNLHFLINTLRTILVNIEQEISRCLLDNSDEFYAEFSVEGLLRADTTARATLYSIALQNGWMSRNEVRRLENLPPIDGGDVYTVQSNLMPIEKLGQTDDAANAQAALRRWLLTVENDIAAAPATT